jgi:hypothetical protein
MATANPPTPEQAPHKLPKVMGTTFGCAINKGTARGDSLPSHHPVHWAGHVTKRCVFPPFDTHPQQDLKTDGKGINILEVIDDRAQPWNEITRANIHDHAVAALPPKTATDMEVKEWIYLVLTQRKFADWVDRTPYLVCITLSQWRSDGERLRFFWYNSSWRKVCPKSFINTDKDTVKVSKADRKQVAKALSSTVVPLITAETCAESQARRYAKAKAKMDKAEKRALEPVSYLFVILLYQVLTNFLVKICMGQEGFVLWWDVG